MAATIPFDPAIFGAALNNGRMVLDMAPRSKASDALRKLARGLSGEKGPQPTVAAPSILKKLRELGKR